MALSETRPMQARAWIRRQSRWSVYEVLFWLAALLPFYFMPTYLTLASQVAIAALFALSVDLILGYAGIITLGHAMFFGLGAYCAGLITKAGWGEPLTGLLIAGAFAALVGWIMSFIIVRVRHLALLMITLGLGLLTAELANSLRWLTGGTDGLQGVDVWPIFGRYDFDLWGYTAYAYALVVLFLGVLLARRLVNSSFGLSLRGVRENLNRMPAIGSPYRRHLQTIYTISAGMAGVAGALLTQTTETVSLDTLSFQRSADVVVMLILGGTGRLYGGILGAIIFMVARDQLSDMNPPWYFWIGPARRGVLARPAASSAACCSPAGCARRADALRKAEGFGLQLARDIPSPSFRCPLRADRPERRRQDSQPITPAPTRSGRIVLDGTDVTRLSTAARVKAGLARTFQINSLFPDLSPIEAVTLAVCERAGTAGQFWRGLSAHGDSIDEAYAILARLGLGDVATRRTRTLAYGQQRLLEIALALATRPKVLLLDEPAAGVPKGESAELFRVIAELPKDISVLFIEHDMGIVFSFASRIVVLVSGGVLLEAEPEVIRTDPRVREVYLGHGAHG